MNNRGGFLRLGAPQKITGPQLTSTIKSVHTGCSCGRLEASPLQAFLYRFQVLYWLQVLYRLHVCNFQPGIVACVVDNAFIIFLHRSETTARCVIFLNFFFSISCVSFTMVINPFTAAGRIYTSQKRPSRCPRTYIYVQPQFRFYACVKARPPTWLLLHVSEVSSSSVRWSLLALLGFVHWENSSSMLRAVLSKWREAVLWMFQDATQAGTSCTFECFRDDGDRGESWFRLVESEGDGNGGGDWLAEETGDGGAWWKKNDHTARSEQRPRCSNSQWTPVFVEGSSVRIYEHRREWNIASQLSGELQSRSAASKRW